MRQYPANKPIHLKKIVGTPLTWFRRLLMGNSDSAAAVTCSEYSASDIWHAPSASTLQQAQGPQARQSNATSAVIRCTSFML
jgi:hypothetical protein